MFKMKFKWIIPSVLLVVGATTISRSKTATHYPISEQIIAREAYALQELPRKAGAAKNVETFSIRKKFRQRPSTEHRPDLKNLKNTPS